MPASHCFSTCTTIEVTVAGARHRDRPSGTPRGEWFDEPDELDRVARVLASVESEEDPIVPAGMLAARLARSQAFAEANKAEANKRTALLVARWTLDRNGLDGLHFLPPDDLELAELLVNAAAGGTVEAQVVERLSARRRYRGRNGVRRRVGNQPARDGMGHHPWVLGLRRLMPGARDHTAATAATAAHPPRPARRWTRG